MLYTMVCQIDEILSIKVGNLIFDSVKPHVMAIGKGRKSRTVYIMSRTVSILKEHILVEHSKTPNPDASLFFSHSKGLFSKVSMTNNIVKKNRYHGSTHCQACLETIRETQRHLLNKEIRNLSDHNALDIKALFHKLPFASSSYYNPNYVNDCLQDACAGKVGSHIIDANAGDDCPAVGYTIEVGLCLSRGAQG